MSLKKGLVKQAKETQAIAKEQEELKEKYNIEEDVVVVEKSNTIKFLIKYTTAFIHLVFRIILVVLAFIGLCSLIYPAPRQELIKIATQTIQEIANYI